MRQTSVFSYCQALVTLDQTPLSPCENLLDQLKSAPEGSYTARLAKALSVVNQEYGEHSSILSLSTHSLTLAHLFLQGYEPMPIYGLKYY